MKMKYIFGMIAGLTVLASNVNAQDVKPAGKKVITVTSGAEYIVKPTGSYYVNFTGSG